MVLQLLRYLGFSAILVLITVTAPVVYADWRDEMYYPEELDYNYKINNGEVKKIHFSEYALFFDLQNINSNAKLTVDIPYGYFPIMNKENLRDFILLVNDQEFDILEHLQNYTITILINDNYSGYSLENLQNRNPYHQTFEIKVPIHSESLEIIGPWSP